jgi:hypothetical protein
MADQLLDTTTAEAKKVYCRPTLTKLGSLRDMTMSSSNVGANDGMTNKGTKRGGNFEACER